MITLLETPNFSISRDTPIEEAAKSGFVSFRVKVRGFWSRESITGYIRRDRSTGEWVPTVSSSSGGRDEKEVPSDLAAYAYFAQALQGLITYLEDLGIDFEHIYQTEVKARKDEEIRRLEADPAFTEEQANALLNTLVQALKNGSETYALVFARGSNQIGSVTKIRAYAKGKGVAYISESFIGKPLKTSKKEMITYLTTFSKGFSADFKIVQK